jgi:hypothetical protein
MGIDYGLARYDQQEVPRTNGQEVPANTGGEVVSTTYYELLLHQMIKAGIKGNTQARKLVLDFMIAAMEREGRQKTEEPAHEAVAEPAKVIHWNDAKKKLLEAAGWPD